jgi:Patatin-like phospholipase
MVGGDGVGADGSRPPSMGLLDGGGIRGLSELCILREIMNHLKYKLKLDKSPLPADYFDLIDGTSTGGYCTISMPFTLPSLTKAARLIPLLLGRLRFSVSDALDLYGELAKKVFGQKRRYLRDGTFDPVHLEQTVKHCITEALGNGHEEDTMLDPKDV